VVINDIDVDDDDSDNSSGTGNDSDSENAAAAADDDDDDDDVSDDDDDGAVNDVLFRLIQEEKDSAEQRAEELESQVGGVPLGGDPSAAGQEAMVARWHAHQGYGQMSPPGNDLPAVPSPAMHPRSAISQQKYLVVSQCCHCHDLLLCGTCSRPVSFVRPVHRGQYWPSITLPLRTTYHQTWLPLIYIKVKCHFAVDVVW